LRKYKNCAKSLLHLLSFEDNLKNETRKQRAELKAKTVLERKKENSRIVETEPKSSLAKNANMSQSF
jgi:hypothetical protein